MAQNLTAIDRINQRLPPYFNSTVNPNWKSIVTAIGQSDQNVANLIQQVKEQFFVSSAARPYLDSLGSNVGVSRPPFIGMSDDDFRKYIPVLAYQPKQVRAIFDQLLNIFFLRETTTAFISSTNIQPFNMQNTWGLQYTVDGVNMESVIFNSSDFSNIAAATAAEIAASINRQAQYSFAIPYTNGATNTSTVRIFTNTVGSTGSIQLTGGLANIALQFQNYITNAGNKIDTVWTVTRVGNFTTFQWTGGSSPNIPNIQAGAIALIQLPGNAGSFPIISVNASNNSFTFSNMLSTPGVYDQSILPNTYVQFMMPEKAVIFTQNIRAVTWEVSTGEIIIEMPATPPVVKRSLIGSGHLNGVTSTVTNSVDSSTLELADASKFPVHGGQFVLQPVNEIFSRIIGGSVDIVTSFQFNSSFNVAQQRYSFTGVSGNNLTGVSPALPAVSDTFQVNLTSVTRNGSGVITAITATPNTFGIGDYVIIDGATGSLSTTPNGVFPIQSIIDESTFTYNSPGDAGTDTGGTALVERIGMANSGSLVYLTTANINTGIFGPYIWDLNAPFVLSSMTTTITMNILAGNVVKVLTITTPNNIPNETGFLIFDFGLETQEGPVRYLLKPNDGTITLDPSYVFLHNHSTGSEITVISSKGAHVMSGIGSEYPLYVTDPTQARAVLEGLIEQVSSVGFFIEFLIRFPQQYYNAYNVYGTV